MPRTGAVFEMWCLKADKEDELQSKDSFVVAHSCQNKRTRRVIRISYCSSMTAVNTYVISPFSFHSTVTLCSRGPRINTSVWISDFQTLSSRFMSLVMNGVIRHIMTPWSNNLPKPLYKEESLSVFCQDILYKQQQMKVCQHPLNFSHTLV